VHRAVNKRLREKAMVMGSDSESDCTPTVSASASPVSRPFLFSRSRPLAGSAEHNNRHLDAMGSDDSSSRLNDSLAGGGAAASRGLCALKLVNKQEFWKQVETGLERKDTMVREVLAQSCLLNSIISCGPSSGQDMGSLALHEMELPIVQINGVFESRWVGE
jgi:hypothetical protein